LGTSYITLLELQPGSLQANPGGSFRQKYFYLDCLF
jgi:hypothetical protein